MEKNINLEKLADIPWLKECEICNIGLCKQVDEYKGRGMSETATFKQMEKDSQGLWSADKIRQRYKYYTGVRISHPRKKKEEIETEYEGSEYRDAMITARLALTELRNIKKNDKNRLEAVALVEKWVKKHQNMK